MTRWLETAQWLPMSDAPNTLGEFPADWDGLGKAAGFIRNKQMLDEGHPHLGLGFTDDLATSRGTSDMARRLEAARVPYLIIGKQKPPRR